MAVPLHDLPGLAPNQVIPAGFHEYLLGHVLRKLRAGEPGMHLGALPGSLQAMVDTDAAGEESDRDADGEDNDRISGDEEEDEDDEEEDDDRYCKQTGLGTYFWEHKGGVHIRPQSKQLGDTGTSLRHGDGDADLEMSTTHV
ncbi:hypothetical protein M7I_5032 [Glarea lozoyensis 74030]|uniref:Uncharacterized protein n=1 Tax=Glarea lozoyensis (strain ATCC 74030 / MF5533) TaxID=1104152 RepID=H0EQS7_GLAL7|nr:hypothetical protein M7I_5032 [Glarea lozoyensis 74030]